MTAIDQTVESHDDGAPAAMSTNVDKPKRKGVMGRPTVWNADLEARLFDTLKTGCSLKDAAERCGIDYSTLKARRRADADFSTRVARARVEFKICTLATLANAIAQGNVTAATWYLERSYPEEYGRQRLEITGADGGAVQVDAALSVADNVRKSSAASRAMHDALALAVEADTK